MIFLCFWSILLDNSFWYLNLNLKLPCQKLPHCPLCICKHCKVSFWYCILKHLLDVFVVWEKTILILFLVRITLWFLNRVRDAVQYSMCYIGTKSSILVCKSPISAVLDLKVCWFNASKASKKLIFKFNRIQFGLIKSANLFFAPTTRIFLKDSSFEVVFRSLFLFVIDLTSLC